MTQIANDTFQDTNGTALTSHTSDSGHTWAATPGSASAFTIDTAAFGTKGAYGLTVSSTAEAVISRVPDSADYTVSIDFKAHSVATWDFPGVILRSASGADTMYRAFLTAGAGGAGFAAVFTDKVVAGTETQLGTNSGDLACADDDTLRLTVGIAGSTLTIDLLNVTTSASISTQTHTDSAISAVGQAGIMHQQQPTGGPRQVLTNFSLSETGGAPGPTSPYVFRSSRIAHRRGRR